MSAFTNWRKQEKKDNPILKAKKEHDKALEGLITTPELDQEMKRIRDNFEQDKNNLREDFNNKLQLLILENINKEIDLINKHKNSLI